MGKCYASGAWVNVAAEATAAAGSVSRRPGTLRSEHQATPPGGRGSGTITKA